MSDPTRSSGAPATRIVEGMLEDGGSPLGNGLLYDKLADVRSGTALITGRAPPPCGGPVFGLVDGGEPEPLGDAVAHVASEPLQASMPSVVHSNLGAQRGGRGG